MKPLGGQSGGRTIGSGASRPRRPERRGGGAPGGTAPQRQPRRRRRGAIAGISALAGRRARLRRAPNTAWRAYGPFSIATSAGGDKCVDSGTGANLAFTSEAQALTGPDAEGNYGATASFVPNSAGRYEWVASFSGDLNNGASNTSSDASHKNVASNCQEATGFSSLSNGSPVTSP